MRLIDANKLLNDMKQRFEMLENKLPIDDEASFQRNDGQMSAIERYIRQLEAGAFDITTEPTPNFKVVYHNCWSLIVTNTGLHWEKEYFCRPTDDELESTRQLLGAERYELQEINIDGH